MSTVRQNISNAPAGNINVIAGNLHNEQVIRSSETFKLKYKPTALRSAQLERMNVCNRFIKAFAGTDFFDRSFPAYSDTHNGFQRVLNVLMNKATTGSYPGIHISYPHVLISKGKLPAAKNAAVAPMKNGDIYFNFTDNSNTGSAKATDKIIVVAYCEQLQQAAFSLRAGLRKDCEAILKTRIFKGYAVETWIGFLSNDEINASNSVYTGRVQLGFGRMLQH